MSGLKDHVVRVDPVDAEDVLSGFAGVLMRHGAVPVAHKSDHGPIVERGSGRRLLGLIHADRVADREHPKTTKARSMVNPVHTVGSSAGVDEVAANLVETHVRALPVVDGEDYVGLVTERSMVDLPEIVQDRSPVETLASDPVTVREDRTVGHVRAVMREHRIGRLPVVDASGTLLGLVEWTNLVLVETRQDRDRRLIAQEPVPSSRLQATVAMDSKPLVVGTKDAVGDVAQRMKQMDRSSAVLVEGKRPVGIVTCEDLLEPVAARFARTAEGIYVQITGLDHDHVDSFDRSAVDRVVQENLQRFFHAVKDPEFLYLHVKSYKEEGDRQKWSVRSRLADGKGTVNARAHGYDLKEVVDNAMQRLGRIVLEDREHRRDRRRSQSAREAHSQGL